MADNQRLTTPRGIAVYPHLHAPDTKFKDEGEYSTKLKFEGKAAAAMRKQLDSLNEQARQAAMASLIEKGKVKSKKAAAKKVQVNEPYEVELDEDGEETGAILVNFKMKASGISKRTGEKWSRTVPLFDGVGQSIKPGLKIGGGSVLKVSWEPYIYPNEFQPYSPTIGAGVSRRLVAVQVIDLKTWGGNSNPDAFGFGVEEDAFSVDEADDYAFAGDDDEGDEFAEDYDEGDEEGDDGIDF